jgi:hypothetical protein
MALLTSRSQDVTEGPIGHLSGLPSRDLVPEAKVDALVDASVNDIVRYL